MSFKGRLVRVARSLGVYVSRYPPPDSLAHHLRELFEALEINGVLDVGAFDGSSLRFLRREVGFKGHVVSFEPSRDNFQLLYTSAANDPKWRGYNYALGRDPGTQTFTVFGDGHFNSFLSANAFGRARFPTLQHPSDEAVEIRRLSDVLDEATAHISEPRLFLKIDTQGFDMEVVEGSIGVLDRVLGMQIELPIRQIYTGMATFPASVERLAGLGFELSGMFPVSRGHNYEFDCVLWAQTARPGASSGV